jgi:SAM-dependent methyltransferase
MYHLEDTHWWYLGLHELTLKLLSNKLNLARNFSVLDAGCGTGKLLDRLCNMNLACVGMDSSATAVGFCLKRNLPGLIRGSISDIPIRSGLLDVVISLDVLSYLKLNKVDEAVSEFNRVLKPSGLLILNLPAHNFLRSAHDVAVGMHMRFGKYQLASILRKAGFTVNLCTYHNTFLFSVAAIIRLLKRVTWRQQRGPLRSDLWPLPRPLNRALTWILRFENYLLLSGLSLPIGLSLVALASKSGKLKRMDANV